MASQSATEYFKFNGKKKTESFAESFAIVNVVIVNTSSSSFKIVGYLVPVTCSFPV